VKKKRVDLEFCYPTSDTKRKPIPELTIKWMFQSEIQDDAKEVKRVKIVS
jgi:hypothetical protein